MTQRKSSAEIAVAQDVGGRIRYLRGALSQAEFAAKLGITRAALANYELGRSLAPDEVLAKIREVTGGVIDPPVYVQELRNRLVNEFGFVQRSAITDDEWAVVRTLRALSNEDARRVISELSSDIRNWPENGGAKFVHGSGGVTWGPPGSSCSRRWTSPPCGRCRPRPMSMPTGARCPWAWTTTSGSKATSIPCPMS